jgi:thymidylate kinase
VLEHSWRQWRRISGFLARDYVVVCDRYTLDSIVSLRCLIDSRCRFALQRRLLRTLTRRPAAAYLLEVPPKTAWRRKGEQSLESLKCHHALYREEREALGVVRLDGERPADDLAAQIAREAYAALRARRRRGVNMLRASCRGR